MRFLTLTILVLFTAPIMASDCTNDYSGTQRTLGFDYEISDPADLARNLYDFVNATTNWMYSTDEGVELRLRLVDGIRLRDLPVYFPACNDIGQCASMSVRTEAFNIFGFKWPGFHRGFTITGSMNGSTHSRFIQADSAVALVPLSWQNATDKRCRDNKGNLVDPPVDDSDGDEWDEEEEDSYDDEGYDSQDELDIDDIFADEDPCESCDFYFDGDEDGDLNLDEPYDPTHTEDDDGEINVIEA